MKKQTVYHCIPGERRERRNYEMVEYGGRNRTGTDRQRYQGWA